MGAIKEVSGAVMPYAFLGAVVVGLYLMRDKIWGAFTGFLDDNPVSNAVKTADIVLQDTGYNAGIFVQEKTDEMKCALGDQYACDRVAWRNAGSPSVTPTEWSGDPDNITIGSMTLLSGGLLAELYGTPEQQLETLNAFSGPSTDENYESALANVEPAKPITGPVNPSLDPWSMPDEVIYQQKYAGIVAGFAPYSPGFDIIAEKGSRILFRSDNSWGIIDTSMTGIGGEPGKQVMAGSRGSGIPFGAW
jgi:hypothetical protein